MPMELLNTYQFLELLGAYLCVIVVLPALVFYRKVKRFPAAVRFLTYFTIGNFYIINLVQVLELVFCSYRSTLLLFTFLPAGLAAAAVNRVPVVSYCKTVADELRHYILRELGFRSFLRRRLGELRCLLCRVGRHLWRLLKELWLDLPFFAAFLWVIWKVNWPGILNNWGFSESDLPVHNYWINGLIDNQLYIGGIYPMGMHCMLYYLATVLKMPAYVPLRLFWLVQYGMIVLTMLAFLKGCCKSRFLPYLGVIGYTGLGLFIQQTYSRFVATLPQEFGMMFIAPAIFFVIAFFRQRKSELEQGINRIRCTSTWMLLGFALNLSLTLTSHFYDTIALALILVGITIGYSGLVWRKAYFWRIALWGILGILLSIFPMAVAFLTGKPLQGSMYWAMNLIGLRDYTVLIFQVICIGTVAIAAGGAAFLAVKLKSGALSLGDRPIPQESPLLCHIWALCGILLFGALVIITWIYRGTLIGCFQSRVLFLRDGKWYHYGVMAAFLVCILRRKDADGSLLLSMLAAELLWGFVLACDVIDWPILMEPSRTCVYTAYLIPVVVVLTLDHGVALLVPARFGTLRSAASWILTVSLLIVFWKPDFLRRPADGKTLEMNEAILCTTNILAENQKNTGRWTIVSSNDELRMTEQYGRHVETITFLKDMEFWHENKEVKIPTDRVYFYIEKKPLNYAGGYPGTIPEISEEEAAKTLPENSGINAYTGLNRAITMSRMYYWSQAFLELYPNDLKVYYDSERFVCYYIEQNPYRLYNFAIDYGFNLPKSEDPAKE